MLSRRNAFQALLLGGWATAGSEAADDIPLTIESLRAAASFSGLDLGEDRLRILLPVLENRRRQLRELRAIRVEDHAGPHLPTGF